MVNVCNNVKLYCSSFAWFHLGIQVSGNITRELVAYQNYENRMLIDRTVHEKN